MKDYDEATIRGMRQILNDRERAKNGCAKPEDMRPFFKTPEDQLRDAEQMRNAYQWSNDEIDQFLKQNAPPMKINLARALNANRFYMPPEAFGAVGVQLPPLTWRQRLKNWIGRMLGA